MKKLRHYKIKYICSYGSKCHNHFCDHAKLHNFMEKECDKTYWCEEWSVRGYKQKEVKCIRKQL